MTGFVFNTTTNTQTSGGERKEVKWDDLNAHVIEAAGTASKARSIPGVISGIYDLGEQEREDGEKVFTGDKAAEDKITAEKPNTYFKDGTDDKGNKVRLECWPQKAVQQVAIAVDFPQVIVDKGQFFGTSNPLPLRMLLNGEFSLSDGIKIVGRPYSISETKHDIGGNKHVWAFAKNNGLHKLADAVEILDGNGLFTKNRIGELLGKVALFQFRVYMKPSKKDPSKLYFTEEIKLSGVIPEGISAPAIPEGILHGVNLYGENDPEAVKQLRLCVKNTIKRANNYEGSNIKPLLDAQAQGSSQSTPAPKSDDTAPVLVASTNIEPQLDDDVPF
ncbi:DNA primase/helicase [Pseudomonas phage phiK7A1]|uniref:DNA primase/helicase n=1 Tax=Pseudomonas phage phiK7A1 TaxID=2759194 RepID=A0A7H0XFW3_9CAUD|nr:DNA primase/helicase [Pseudomonas phage phiK7A1]